MLKSPLFGLDDDDLLALAPKRKGSLWQELLARAAGQRRAFDAAAETLQRWRARAERVPPFEFYAGAARRRRHARAHAGSGSAPRRPMPIDEFLNLALAYDDGAPPSLQGFLGWLREGSPRDQARHGAGPRRGARHDRARRQGPGGADRVPARHLLDAVGTAAGRPAAARGRRRGRRGMPPPFLWPVKGTSKVARRAAGQGAIAERAEAEERNRLLYVALTRARDRLYVAGFEGAQGAAAPTAGTI